MVTIYNHQVGCMYVYMYANIRCVHVRQYQLHINISTLTTLFSQNHLVICSCPHHIIASNQSLAVNCIIIIIIIGLVADNLITQF